MKKQIFKTAAIVLLFLLCILIGTAGGRYLSLRTGTRYHPPVVYSLLTGSMFYLDALGVDSQRPWELTNTYETSGGTFQLPEPEFAVQESCFVWRDYGSCISGTVLPNRGYLILDLYDLEHIRAWPIQEGTFLLRDYEVEITALGGGFGVKAWGA